MKTISLPNIWIDRLSKLPETGMGYQKVNFLLKDGSALSNVIVLNAEECEVPDSFDPADINEVQVAE